MTVAQVDDIMSTIDEAHGLYHRLVLLVGPAGSGKTRALQEVSSRTGTGLVNVNLEISRRMLDLTERQRAVHVPQIMREILRDTANDVVLLDNIEILFEPSLEQDPLRLLQGLSRNKTLVVAWNGALTKGFVTYAVPGHPEHRRYNARGLLVVGIGKAV